MPENQNAAMLNPADFKLSEYDNVSITMPEKPALGEDDVNNQLLEFAQSGDATIMSVDELDDEWVKANFDGLNTLDDVRQAIVDQYENELEFTYSDMKYRACCDVLISRLQGEIDPEVLKVNVKNMRENNLQRLESMHITLDQYLREEHLTLDQYEDKLRDETIYLLKLNMALDLYADVLGIQVGNNEITEYLSTPDPEKFLEEIREKGQVEAARQAAKRVKTMRRVLDTALVNGSIEVKEEKKKMFGNDDEEVPDLSSMPAPEIRDDKQHTFRIIES